MASLVSFIMLMSKQKNISELNWNSNAKNEFIETKTCENYVPHNWLWFSNAQYDTTLDLIMAAAGYLRFFQITCF